MGRTLLILGGARSGKSSYALEQLREKAGRSLFLATALPVDPDMAYRIRRHQKERPASIKTLEKFENFKALNDNSDFLNADNVLLDCMTLLVTNQMMNAHENWDIIEPDEVSKIEQKIQEDIRDLLDLCKDKNLIIVSNEVGLGIVPDNMFALYFRDILGRINQFIAKASEQVYFMIASIPVEIKGEVNDTKD